MEKIRLGVFDDHPIVSNGLVNFLENFKRDMQVIFVSNTKTDLIHQLQQHPLDILILDIIAPDVNGLELFSEFRNSYPKLKLIAYSTLKSPVLVENLLSIGVKGFVNKAQQLGDVYEAIKNVNYDLISVPEKYKYLTSRFHQTTKTSLTGREMEILKLISQEKTTDEIAKTIGVSIKTVENQKLSLFKKLEVKNSAGLILAATRLGYIS